MRAAWTIVLLIFSVWVFGDNVVKNLDSKYEAKEGLEGENIVLWAGHGLYFNTESERWQWQRAPVMTTVEDKLTMSYVLQYLEPMLERAGAQVFMPRERDLSGYEMINESQRGKTINTSSKRQDKTRSFDLKVNEDGWYWVSVRYEYNAKAIDEVLIDIEHDGGTTRFTIDQRKGYGTWIYLDKFYFKKNEPGKLLIHSENDKKGEIILPTVRVGGGRGASGQLRAWECASEWLKYSGAPYEVYSYHKGTDNYKDDIKCRPLWVNWLNSRVPIGLALAFHTDAGVKKENIVGTLGIYTTNGYDKNGNSTSRLASGKNRSTCSKLAQSVTNTLINDIQKQCAPEWKSRGLKDQNYYETSHCVVPSMLLELLSHQNFWDMRYGLDPRFKFVACRAIYKGILKYMKGKDAVVQPLPIHNFSASMDQEKVILNWEETPDSLEPTAKADGYIVYKRNGQGGWDNGTAVKMNHYECPIKAGEMLSFKVVAMNEGGISMDSEILAVGKSKNSRGKILIVDCFDRQCAPEGFCALPYVGFANWTDKGVGEGEIIDYLGEMVDFDINHEWVTDDAAGWGHSVSRNQFDILKGNSLDNAIIHGKWWMEQGYDFCSSSKGAFVRDSALWCVTAIDMLFGQQKTTRIFAGETSFKALDDSIFNALDGALYEGADVIISGANILTDVFRDTIYTKEERTRFTKLTGCQWKASMASQDGKIRYTISETMGLSTKADIESLGNVDGLEPVGKNTEVIMRYQQTGLPAGTVTRRQDGGRIFLLGLPFECLF